MASQLPTFPRFVFTIAEPISLVFGAIYAIAWPDWFTAEQLGTPAAALTALTGHSRVVARQLGNCYGLAFLVAVAVLYSTSEPRVVRNYLVALWLADIGHVAISCLALGRDQALAVADWNILAWGNIGITAFLFFTRTAYFLGLFGPDKPHPAQLLRKKAK
ncbi:hypothetical protein B0T24DRAFT_634574 [Lasiosphaeria ovina]|uniref:DUF7704 domain-containing protein n=1 Tax=Lasiosphaeria ovina TaxID=92902 RepID=A0AAE0N1A4_9PEZI|nr:hypothetical protein B0T24DRAFT_634574 [Lasiosphaeria ovina]